MTSSPIREPCIKCKKGGGIVTCSGCHQWYCTKHFNEHRQELAMQIDDLGQDYDVFRRDLGEENVKHPLMSRINDWEKEFIKKIQLAAEEARKDLQEYLDQNVTQLKTSVSQITQDLKAHRESDNYNEIDINKWTKQLKQLQERMEKLAGIGIMDNDQMQPTIHIIKLQEHQTVVQTPTQVMTRSSKCSIV